jgi:sugar phosphate isomerase/epimerase
MSWPLGVVAVVYGGMPLHEAARLAKQQGFEHIDISGDAPPDLPLPVGDRFAMRPTEGCSAGPAAAGQRSFEQTVADFARVPSCRIEPWAGGVVGSNETTLEILKRVPGLDLLLDVGHVTAWGGDVMELLPHAGHVQLRQAKLGQTQARDGDVDFAAILNELGRIGYTGRLSVEYFDLPDLGWPFEDPVGAALETAEQIRALL